MKRKFTFLVAALALLTMIVQPLKAVGQTTETLNIASYASENDWTNQTRYESATVGNITFTASSGSNTGKYYTTDHTWRFYANESATLTISVSGDNTLVAVTPTFTTKDSGTLSYNSTSVTSGSEVAVSGDAAVFSVGSSSGNKGKVFFTEIKVTYLSSSSTTTPTSITIDASGITNTNVFVGTEAGSLSAVVAETSSGVPVEGATVTWTSDDEEVATIGETTGVVTLVSAGTTTITASYAGNDTYSASTKTYSLTVIDQDPNAPGTINNPYTVADAIDNTPTSGTTDNVYIHGFVSAFYNTSITGDGSNFRYYISDDGTTTSQLLVYRGKGLNNVAFATVDDLLVGDEVVICGKLTTYQNAPEVAANNYIVSLVRPSAAVEAPTFSPAEGIYEEAQNVTISCETDGASIYYTTDGTVPTSASTPYTTAISVESTTTIKAIAYLGGESSTVATATYTIVPVSTIASIEEVGAAYTVVGTVVATNGRGFVMGDGTGYVYYYNNGAVSQSVGDMVKVSGTTGTYGQIIQFTNTATVTDATTSNYDYTPEAETITEVPDYSQDYHLSNYLEFEGRLLLVNGNFKIYLGTEEETVIQVSYPTTDQQSLLTELASDGSAETGFVHVKGYFSGINSSGYFTVMLESCEALATPTITLDYYTIEASAEGLEGNLIVTYANITDVAAEVWFCDAAGENEVEYDWLDAGIDEYNNVYYVIDANGGEARTAYFKVYALDDEANNVYSNLVTISQAAYVTPVIGTEYVLYTGELVEGDYVIYYDGYAMKNTVENSRLTYETVSPENDVVTTDDATIVWHIAPSGDYWTIYSDDAEAYAASTGAKNKAQMLEDGTDDKAKWSVEESEGTFDFKNKANLAANVNAILRNNGDYGFACYAAATGGALSLYKKASTDPSITLSENLLEVEAIGLEGSITVTYANITDVVAEVLFYESDGETSANYDWLYAEIDNKDVNKLDYIIEANTGAARTAYFKVHAFDDDFNDVYSELVTVSQAAYVAPVASITVAPDEVLDVPAVGDDYVHTVTLENLTVENTDDFALEFCDEYGEVLDPQASKPDWIETGDVEFTSTSEENVYSLTYPVAANTETTPRTAYFKVAVTQSSGTVYSNLVTVTQDGAVIYYSVTFDCDGGTFVANDDFPTIEESKLGGTYTLPSATLSGMTFDGWNDGTDTYAAGAEYIVSGNVAFTAQWNDAVTATITFGSAEGSTAINSTQVTGDDSAGNTWTIDTEFEGETSFTQNASYSQVGAAKKPASSITFTTTLPSEVTITAFEAKFGGFSGTAGDITLTVDNTVVATGVLDATTDVIVGGNVNDAYGSVLTITVNNIEKGVKAYYISYSYTSSTNPYITFAESEIDVTAAESEGFIAIAYGNLSISDESDFEVQFCDDEGDELAETPDWIDAEVVTLSGEDGYFVYYTIDENTGDARTAYFKLYALDDEANDVYSNLVTVSQEAPEASITVAPDIMDLDAKIHYIATDSAFTITYQNIEVTNYQSFAIHYYNAEGEEIQLGDDPWYILGVGGTNEEGYQVVGVVMANDGEARTAYFKVSDVNNTVYSNLITVTQAAYVAPPTPGNNYVKVTSTADLTDGQYLIVYEEGDLAFDGSLTTLDAVSNTIPVTISNNEIAVTSETVASEFTIASISEGYSIQSASGYYIGQTSDANGLASSDEIVYTNAISFDEGNANIVSSGAYLRYNSASNQARFRYYKSSSYTGQKAIQLYKKVEAAQTYTLDITGYGTSAGGYRLIASPVTVDPLTTGMITDTIDNFDLFYFNQNEDQEWRNWKSNEEDGHFDLVPGKGYLYANRNDVTITLTGVPYTGNGVITLDKTEGAQFSGLNLVGNPFGTAATINSEKSCYILNEAGTEFIAGPDTIAAMQGIIVYASVDEEELTFTPVNQGQGGNGKSSLNINLMQTNERSNSLVDRAIVRFDNGDNMPKIQFNPNHTKVYIPQDGTNYAVVNAEVGNIIPVNFKAAENGIYTLNFTTENLDLDYLHLIDFVTNDEVDLLTVQNYRFEATTTDHVDRFRLVFSATGIDENDSENGFAFVSNGNIIVTGEGTLRIVDMMGRIIGSYNTNERISTEGMTSGIYVLQLINGEKTMTQKIVVR